MVTRLPERFLQLNHLGAITAALANLRTGLGAAIGPMGKPTLGLGVGRLGLQSLGLKGCLTGLLDRQISGGLCFLP
jgi:hypothetical protein